MILLPITYKTENGYRDYDVYITEADIVDFFYPNSKKSATDYAAAMQMVRNLFNNTRMFEDWLEKEIENEGEFYAWMRKRYHQDFLLQLMKGD